MENYMKNNKNDLKVLNNLSVIQAEKQIDKKLEENFKKVFKDGSHSGMFNYAVFLAKQNMFNEALIVFENLTRQLTHKDPLFLLSHINTGVIYDLTEQHDQGINKFQQIIDEFEDKIDKLEFEEKINEIVNKKFKCNKCDEGGTPTTPKPTLLKPIDKLPISTVTHF